MSLFGKGSKDFYDLNRDGKTTFEEEYLIHKMFETAAQKQDVSSDPFQDDDAEDDDREDE